MPPREIKLPVLKTPEKYHVTVHDGEGGSVEYAIRQVYACSCSAETLFFSLRSGRRTIELLYKRNEKIWEYKVLNVTSGFEAPSRISFSHDLKVALKEVTSECEEANGVWQGPRSLSDTSFRATGLLGLLPEEIMRHTLGMCEESVEVHVHLVEERYGRDFRLQTPIGREEMKSCSIICTIPAESRHAFPDTFISEW